MSSEHDEARVRREDKEPTLKDALMPARPPEERHGDAAGGRRPGPAGDKPSLQDALLPADHQPAPPPDSTSAEPPRPERPRPEPGSGPGNVIPVIVAVAIVAGFIAVFFLGRLSMSRLAGEETAATAPPPDQIAAEAPEASGGSEASGDAGGSELTPPFDDPGPMGLAEIQERGLIVDVHEHIASLELAPKYLAAMDELGIQTMCLMGSSKFTLTLDESYGFTEYDENNEELIKIVEAYPGRFEAWPTVDPEDPDKLEKIQELVARGATGVKLYIGHGYITDDRQYMFHTVAIDDPGMFPLYAWCEENYVPLMLHVNPYGEKTGFAQEFIATLTEFPDLKVIAPHFMLSSVYNPRLEELLDTFPNLYSDVSFGDYFMKERLTYMSKYPDKFQRIFREYPDRFMFAADLVMISGRPDDWAPVQLQAYLDMLTKETYTTPAIREPVPEDEREEGEPATREKPLTGLNLSDDLVSRILFRNYGAFRASRPSGTRITHEIDWENMNQEPVERRPGQAFPPPPK